MAKVSIGVGFFPQARFRGFQRIRQAESRMRGIAIAQFGTVIDAIEYREVVAMPCRHSSDTSDCVQWIPHGSGLNTISTVNKTHAITSVTQPAFRRQPWKNVCMVA